MNLTPKRPYLLQAFYDWIVENNLTPHILVDAEAHDVNVPRQHVKDGKIVLNISPVAVQDFMLDSEALSFSARFGGVSFYIYCPMYAIEAIYAREAPTEGISFSPAEYEDMSDASEEQRSGTDRPMLSAVDTSVEEHPAESSEQDAVESDESSQDDKEQKSPPKRPSLRVVK